MKKIYNMMMLALMSMTLFSCSNWDYRDTPYYIDDIMGSWVSYYGHDGYGEYDEKLIVELTRDKFEFDGEITVGMPFQVMTPSGLSIVHVTKVEGDKITIDGNHELAGKALNFDIEVVNVRDATEEELSPSSGCGGGCGGCGGGCGGGDCGDCGSGCGGCN